MANTHLLQWDAQCVEATNLTHPHVQRVLTDPDSFPQETVKNIKFMQQIVNETKDGCKKIRMQLFWTRPERWAQHGLLQDYFQHAVQPLLHVLQHNLPWLYPYLDDNGSVIHDLDLIPAIEQVGDGMNQLEDLPEPHGSQPPVVQSLATFTRFHTIQQYQLVQSVTAARAVSQSPALLPKGPLKAWFVRIDESHAGSAECYDVFVSVDRIPKMRHPFRDMMHGSSCAITFVKPNKPKSPHLWTGECTHIYDEELWIVNDRRIVFKILARRRTGAGKVPQFCTLIEAVEEDGIGSNIFIHRIQPDEVVQTTINRLELITERPHTVLAAVLIGHCGENDPEATDFGSRYPVKLFTTGVTSESCLTEHDQCLEDRFRYQHWAEKLSGFARLPTWQLDAEQWEAVHLCTANKLINLIQGATGTGKLRTMLASVIMSCYAGAQVMILAPNDFIANEIALRLSDMVPGPRHFVRAAQSAAGYAHHVAQWLICAYKDRTEEAEDLGEAAEALLAAAETLVKHVEGKHVKAMEESELPRSVVDATDKLRSHAYTAANVLITTVQEAFNDDLVRQYQAEIMYVAHASVIKEPELVAAMLSYPQVKQYNLYANPAQISTYDDTKQPLDNEFKDQERYSLFERLRDTGLPVHHLDRLQYRCTPGCNRITHEVLTMEKYDTAASMRGQNHELSDAVKDFNSRFLNTLPNGKPLNADVQEVSFIHVQGLISKTEAFLVSHAEAYNTADLIVRLLHDKPEIKPADICVISYYEDQLKPLRDALDAKSQAPVKHYALAEFPDVRDGQLRTIRTCQGQEFPIVFINFCRNERDFFGLGQNKTHPRPRWIQSDALPIFPLCPRLRDPRCLRTAISRHKYGLYLVGDYGNLTMRMRLEWHKPYAKKDKPDLLKVFEFCERQRIIWLAPQEYAKDGFVPHVNRTTNDNGVKFKHFIGRLVRGGPKDGRFYPAGVPRGSGQEENAAEEAQEE